MATLRAILENPRDEIEFYLNGRYISACEAIWRLYSFTLIDISPPSIRLPVHCEGQRMHVIGEVGEQHYVYNNESELEAFFLLNQQREQEHETGNLYYTQISKYYVWNKSIKC